MDTRPMVSGCAVLVLLTLQAARDVTASVVPDDEKTNWPVLCPPLTFFSRKQSQCLPCSSCPANQIITSPCHGFHDTECGPFYNVDMFEPSPKQAWPESPQPVGSHKKAASPATELANEADLNKHKTPPSNSGDAPISGDTAAAKNSATTFGGNSHHAGAMSDDVIYYSHWEVLTWVICGAIALTALLVIVGGVWVVRRKLREHRKLIDCKYSPPPQEV